MSFLEELDPRLAKVCERFAVDYEPEVLEELAADFEPLEHTEPQWRFFAELLQEVPLTAFMLPPYAVVFEALDPGFREPELFDHWEMAETVDASRFPAKARALFEASTFLRTDIEFCNGDASTMSVVVLDTTDKKAGDWETGSRQLHLVTADFVETFESPLVLLDAVMKS